MKHEYEPLKYSKEARQRVIIGLKWDPQKLPFYMRWFLPKRKLEFDLDLTCYVFNDYGDFIGIVSGEKMVDEDCGGAIYHSGDERTGEYSHDDEQISVELAGLAEDIHHIIFVATCKSAHNFTNVNAPSMRIANAQDNQDQYVALLDEGHEGKDAFIFARLFKDGATWMVDPAEEFVDQKKIDNWPSFLQTRWALA